MNRGKNALLLIRLCCILLLSEHCFYLHLVRLFWNQVLTCASVIFRALARAALSADARYFCRWKRFSSSQICSRVNDVRGFFFLGGVRFWYGWPMRRVTVRGESDTGPERAGRDKRGQGMTGREKEKRRQFKTGSRMWKRQQQNSGPSILTTVYMS